MEDILIISNYWHFINEKSSSRYNSILELFADNFEAVELITSSFYHTSKSQRSLEGIIHQKAKITLLNEPGYTKNVSFRRLYSHFIFQKNVIEYLKNRQKPDVIYLFVPPLGLGKEIISYAKNNNIKVIIDVLDFWPQAFEMILPSKMNFLKVMFLPMKRQAAYIYKNADSVITVSKTYSETIAFYRDNDQPLTLYIGTDISDDFVPYHYDSSRTIKLGYAGTLGHSYDIPLVFKAMEHLKKNYNVQIPFHIYGDGPLREVFERQSKKMDISVIFHGRLEYSKMVDALQTIDILVNPIVNGAAQSIINKHADYAKAGRAVVNTQNSEEYIKLLEDYQAGLSSNAGDVKGLVENIKSLYDSPELLKRLADNQRHVANILFDRRQTYPALIAVVKNLLKEKL